MRINRLRLRHFRGVDECDITFDVDGVTIIEGDNEVGKTCIPEAIDLILTYRHDTTHRAARVVRPVHIDEGPEVELEMTTGPYHFTYAKRWHARQTRIGKRNANREYST